MFSLISTVCKSSRFSSRCFSSLSEDSAEVVICGAGLAGVALAYQLSVKRGISGVVLVDERPPLSLTSALSTECYRNVWGDADMTSLMNRSIDLMEEMSMESDNFFNMTQRGYLYLTSQRSVAEGFASSSEETELLGLGPKRIFSDVNEVTKSWSPPITEGLDPLNTGLDVLANREVVRACFPWVHDEIEGALYARRCGWVDAQQMGAYMLQRARECGTRVITGQVQEIQTNRSGETGSRAITSVVVNKLPLDGSDVVGIGRQSNSKEGVQFSTSTFVNCAGPYAKAVHAMITEGEEEYFELPLENELHVKVVFDDVHGAIPSSAPMTIFADEVNLQWSEEEKHFFSSSSEEENLTKWLGDLPSGVHFRPLSGGYALMLWDFVHANTKIPSWGSSRWNDAWPNPDPSSSFDELYADMVIRGLGVSTLPSLMDKYVNPGVMGNRTSVDGGYYCHTRDNKPLACATPEIEGSFLLAGLSGFGVMSCMGLSDLLATRMTGVRVDYNISSGRDILSIERENILLKKSFLLENYYRNIFEDEEESFEMKGKQKQVGPIAGLGGQI
eukprot:g600.t1